MKVPFQLLGRKVIYEGRVIRLVREELVARGVRLIRETVEHPGAVVIVPILPDGRVLFVRQYRRAIKEYLLELPAGTRDRAESPMACAKRELVEETGWQARKMSLLGSFYSAPGFTSERMILYLAQDLKPTQANPEPDEFVTPVKMKLEDAIKKALNGEIEDGKTIIGLLLAREQLCRLTRRR